MINLSKKAWLGLVAAGLALVVYEVTKKKLDAAATTDVELPKTFGDVADTATQDALSVSGDTKSKAKKPVVKKPAPKRVTVIHTENGSLITIAPNPDLDERQPRLFTPSSRGTSEQEHGSENKPGSFREY